MPRFEIPADKYGRPLYNATPRATALARTVQALTSSFWLELNAETTLIRVYAIDKDIYLKWAIDDEDYATSTDFDEVIPSGQYIDLIVPLRETESASNGTQFPGVHLVGRESGSTAIVIEK